VTRFAYRVATADGRQLQGIEDAASAAALERALSGRGLFPIELRQAESGAPRAGRSRYASRRGSVAEAFRYLAALVAGDFPLDRALGTVARVAGRDDLAAAIGQVRTRVRGGSPLADAMAEHPRLFPPLAVGMARAGERGGHLAESLTLLADQLEREHALRARLMSALLYPAIMCTAGGAAILVLLFFVLPRLVSLLEETGAPVPFSTAILLGVGQLAATWWPAALLALLLASLAFASYRATEAGAVAIDRFLLRMPGIGALRGQLAAVRLGRALGTLLRVGHPVLPALDVAAHAISDRAVVEELRRAREEVRAGSRLADALGRGRALPFMFLQMVEVGEDGGRLPEMLERAALATEQKLERALDRLVRLAEPVMILLFGGVVGFIALALLRAVYGVRPDAFQP